MTGEFPAQRSSNAENVSIWWRHHDELILTGDISSCHDVILRCHQTRLALWQPSNFNEYVIKRCEMCDHYLQLQLYISSETDGILGHYFRTKFVFVKTILVTKYVILNSSKSRKKRLLRPINKICYVTDSLTNERCTSKECLPQLFEESVVTSSTLVTCPSILFHGKHQRWQLLTLQIDLLKFKTFMEVYALIEVITSNATDGIFRRWGPIPSLLMHWLLKSPVHQQSCCWLCRANDMYFFSRLNLIYLGQTKSKMRFKMWIYLR